MKVRVAPALFAVVLVSFLLPWFAVSCQGQTMVTASGIQILTNSFSSPMMDSFEEWGGDTAMTEAETEEMQEEFEVGAGWRLAAFVVLVCALAGLVLTLRSANVPPRWAAALGGVQSVLLLLVLLQGPSSFRNRLAESGASESSSDGDLFGGLDEAMNDMMLNAVKLDFQSGFYLALMASLAVAGLGYLAWRQQSLLPTVTLSPSATDASLGPGAGPIAATEPDPDDAEAPS